ncbi:signal transducing kinase of the PAK [Ceratobasidium sp. 428]|nr:signal transducing kinase of the PAK [Ceratobasidium sp. 428]
MSKSPPPRSLSTVAQYDNSDPELNYYDEHQPQNLTYSPSNISPTSLSSSTLSTKRKKNRLSLMDRLLGTSKRPERLEISTPYDPVTLIHVGFNSSTGEYTGLPKEWQRLLSDSGITYAEQERNPQAVIEVMKFYQETHPDVHDTELDSPSSPTEVPRRLPMNHPKAYNSDFWKLSGPWEQPPTVPAQGPSLNMWDAYDTTSPTRPAQSHDRSNSEQISSSSSSQPQVVRSKSQRNAAPQTKVIAHNHQRDRVGKTTVRTVPGGPTGNLGGRNNAVPPPSVKPVTTNQQPHAPNAIITSLMTISEVVTRLGTRGCPDLNDQLDESSCSKYPISNGGYGDVYRAKLKDGTEVAIKTMRLLLDAEGQKHVKHAARELYTWSKCRHQNVQRLLGLVEFRDQIGMVSTWEVNGDLSTYLRQHPEADRYQISVQVAEGLAYLHQNGIAHGDLKAANVLVSINGVPLLSDFGNATLHEYTLKFTQTATKSGISSRWAVGFLGSILNTSLRYDASTGPGTYQRHSNIQFSRRRVCVRNDYTSMNICALYAAYSDTWPHRKQSQVVYHGRARRN